MHYIHVYNICMINCLSVLINYGISISKYWNIFGPFSHIRLSRTFCTQSHRVAVASGHREIYLGEASSQLSWGENLRMGSWNTSTQIEPFPLVACNGWGLGCPTSPTRTIVGINLGAFRVIHPWSRYSQLEPALGRAMPVRESYPEMGHIKE